MALSSTAPRLSLPGLLSDMFLDALEVLGPSEVPGTRAGARRRPQFVAQMFPPLGEWVMLPPKLPAWALSRTQSYLWPRASLPSPAGKIYIQAKPCIILGTEFEEDTIGTRSCLDSSRLKQGLQGGPGAPELYFPHTLTSFLPLKSPVHCDPAALEPTECRP